MTDITTTLQWSRNLHLWEVRGRGECNGHIVKFSAWLSQAERDDGLILKARRSEVRRKIIGLLEKKVRAHARLSEQHSPTSA